MWQSITFKSLQPHDDMCHDLATQNSANEVVPRHHHLLPSNPRHLHPIVALHLAAATITTVSRPSTVITAPAGCTRPPQHSLTIDAGSRTSVAPFSRCPHQNAKTSTDLQQRIQQQHLHSSSQIWNSGKHEPTKLPCDALATIRESRFREQRRERERAITVAETTAIATQQRTPSDSSTTVMQVWATTDLLNHLLH